jgi:hypothetical protein
MACTEIFRSSSANPENEPDEAVMTNFSIKAR